LTFHTFDCEDREGWPTQVKCVCGHLGEWAYVSRKYDNEPLQSCKEPPFELIKLWNETEACEDDDDE